jgi:putative ABC transport system permease protein
MREDNAPAWRRYSRFWGSNASADVSEELAFHIEQRVADLMSEEGMTEAAARRETMRRIGDVEALARQCQDLSLERERMQRRRDWIGEVRSDVRLAFRQFRRVPVLTAVAMITLGLGLGANTAIFSIVNAVLLRPLRFDDSDRMVMVRELNQGSDYNAGPGTFTEWVRRSRSFESLSAQTGATFNITQGGAPERLRGAYVTPSFFRTNYLAPEHGRYLAEEEAEQGRNHVVVLSHDLFMRRFGGNRRVVGSSVLLNEEPYTIVGVAPAAFRMDGNDAELWVPLALTAADRARFNEHWLIVFGKLKPGVAVDAANADIARVTAEIAAEHPDDMLNWTANVVPAARWIAGDYRKQLLVLFGAVSVILLIACLNVSSLLVARATARRKEMAVRSALGASRWRLVRQVVTESVALAMMGGVVALIVARLSLTALMRIAPEGVPRLDQAGITSGVLLFCAASSLFAGVVLSALPALRSSRVNMLRALRDSGKNTSEGNTRDALRSLLVVGEVALALALLAGAGLFIRSAMNLNRVDAGFDPSNLMSLHFSLPGQRYSTPEQVAQAYDEIAARIAQVPGVEKVSATAAAPLSGGGAGVELHLPDRTFAPGTEEYMHYNIAMPGYFDLMKIPIVRGRAINAQDRATSAPVVVVNETMARRIWPNENPLGKRLSCCSGGKDVVWREVVGVSRDVKMSLAGETESEMYVPHTQVPAMSWIWYSNSLTMVYRSRGSAQQTLPAVRRAIASYDANLPLFNLHSFEDLRKRSTAANDFSLSLLACLAAVALILAAVGIYGVIAYFVQQRTQEIGIRMALGARGADVVQLVLRQAAALAVCGIACGLLLSLGAGRAVQSLLFNVHATDWATYGVVSTCMAVVILGAAYIPARRATRVDPLSSIR